MAQSQSEEMSRKSRANPPHGPYVPPPSVHPQWGGLVLPHGDISRGNPGGSGFTPGLSKKQALAFFFKASQMSS